MADDQESGSTVGDLTPEVGAATDVAPVGLKTKPAHELTAAEDSDPVDWSRVTQMPEFRAMVRAKLRFIIPAVVFFVVYYFALPGATAAAHLIQSPPIFPLENPGIVSIPLGFIGAVLGTLLRREPAAEAKYDELLVRASTGLGAEKASGH